MKKMLLLALSLVSMTAQAQLTESPWTTEEVKEDTFFLYNVESGMWLQHNRRVRNRWTTRAELGPHGIDLVLVALEDGKWRIDPRYGGNHNINGYEVGDNASLYMDTGQPVTPWTFTASGLGYEITTEDMNHYLNVTDDPVVGYILDDYGDSGTWQLVKKETRMADLMTATKKNPKDATWLIGNWDLSNMDDRRESWVNTVEGSGHGSAGVAFREGYGCNGNRAAECWNKGHGDYYQIIKGLPNGTYGLTVQGYYRDGATDGVAAKHDEGTEVIRGFYFANDVVAPLMSICANGVTEPSDDKFPAEVGGYYLPGDGGDALPRATTAFFEGYYQNPEITVVVSDGTLRIGIRKDSDTGGDWLCFDNFELTYYGEEIDIEPVRENLIKTLGEATEYEGTKLPNLAECIAAAEALKTSSDAKAIANAVTNLQNALIATKAMNTALANAAAIMESEWKPNFFLTANAQAQIDAQSTDISAVSEAAKVLRDAVNDANGAIDAHDFFLATIPFATQDGVASDKIAAYGEIITASESLRAMNDALNNLRTDRKIAVADKIADVFAGNAPAEGEFYLYNVGQQRFLTGGGDWGAHAYVGWPGNVISIYPDTYEPEEGEPYSGFVFDTQLFNGDNNHYLNYGGYVDTPNQDLWEFIPVEGKAGVYNIARANKEANGEGQRMLLGYTPNTYGQIDTDKYVESNPDNQWRLVTVADRDALLKTATKEAPQDATYKIQSPGFNQREDKSAWMRDAGSVYGEGGNNPDFAFEFWNTTVCDLSQVVYDLEPGYYVLGVQGYYREGSHEDQIRIIAGGGEAAQQAEFLSDMESMKLMNITAEIGKAPGMGERVSLYPLIQQVDEVGEPVYDEATGDPVMVEDKTADLIYIGEFPKWIHQACNWFQTGLYKNEMLVQVDNSGTLSIAITKDYEYPGDWVVVDNFRLTYYGKQEPVGVEDVTDKLAKRPAKRYFNIMGQPVQGKLRRGLYIREDGAKAIIK